MKVLVVEDEKDISDFLRKSFEREFFAVDIARDGDQALQMVQKNTYDIVTLDHLLPKKTGLEVCREIRSTNKTMPILMLSVKSETVTKVDLLNAGADDYLTKPFAVSELMARVRALLRRPQEIHGDIMSVDNLVLDVQRHVVSRAKKDIHLTRKEFMLLEYLMRHQGTPVSKGMLIDHVWGKSIDPFSNTIEAHIVSLRRKVDLPGMNKLIHTVPTLGYKFDIKGD